MPTSRHDALVVGAGPNGLAAAVTLAATGRSVLVVEGADTVGGGARSAELTLPGFVHDPCSAIHPLAVVSPFFRDAALARHGLRFAYPDAALAHPLDDGSAAVLHQDFDATAATLGPDGAAWRAVFAPLAERFEALFDDVLAPLRRPRHPVVLARFGLQAIRSADGFNRRHFTATPARSLFAGSAAHSILPLEQAVTAGFGLGLTILGHAVGWPCVVGGSQGIADALASRLRELGGEIQTGSRVESVDELPPANAVLFDVTPRQLLRIAGHRFPARYRRALGRYRYGPGVFKVDWALDAPVPWTAEGCHRAGTVHVGGTDVEVAAAEQAVWDGRVPERPFVLVAQQSRFDLSRAPAGKHTLWGYCHVPAGCDVDMTERIEAQIERFAPGFRDRILARHVAGPAQVERDNPNYVGGDINGGVQDLRQLFTRPVARPVPYTTPDPSLYLCSSATPPGGGVHGMCGVFAARAALRRAPW